MALTEAISDIYAEINNYGSYSPKYYEKMIHKIPDAKSVDRVKFIKQRCLDNLVVHLGCVGPLHELIEGVAKETWGFDKIPKDKIEGISNYIEMDFENPDSLFPSKAIETAEVVVCGEVLEHLSNPGIFLEKMRDFTCPIIITVPNAFCRHGYDWITKGKENVNKDHVSYYSYHTLKILVERYGYKIEEFYWYGGQARVSEGLVFVVKWENKNEIS